jgi:hypothetical protein
MPLDLLLDRIARIAGVLLAVRPVVGWWWGWHGFALVCMVLVRLC